MTLQTCISAATPTMDTLHRCALAALMLSMMLLGSHVAKEANRITTAGRQQNHFDSHLHLPRHNLQHHRLFAKCIVMHKSNSSSRDEGAQPQS